MRPPRAYRIRSCRAYSPSPDIAWTKRTRCGRSRQCDAGSGRPDDDAGRRDHYWNVRGRRRGFSTATPSTTPPVLSRPVDRRSRAVSPGTTASCAPGIKWNMANPSTEPVAVSFPDPIRTGGVCGPAVSPPATHWSPASAQIRRPAAAGRAGLLRKREQRGSRPLPPGLPASRT